MGANQVVSFLEKPIINVIIYAAIFCMLLFSFFKYRKGHKEYSYVAFSFVLFMFARIIQNIIFIYHVRPRTAVGVILLTVILLFVIGGSILVFYIPSRMKNKS